MAAVNQKIIVIVGQTASGKSDMAIKLADKYNGEIIAADSRTIYKYTDIGTAKPFAEVRKKIKHHLIDIINPDQSFSASDFKEKAQGLINQIHERGKLPIVAGGTGLYVNSLIYDYEFGSAPDAKLRSELEEKSLENLQEQVRKLPLAENQINLKNKRHLIRAIENKGIIKNSAVLRENTLVVGIKVEPEDLRSRIIQRNEKMIENGLEQEVSVLLERYDWSSPGMNSIGYKEWKEYFSGLDGLDEVKKKLFKDNWQYARRQKIWFKRDPNIKWVTSLDEAIRHVDQFLIQLGS